MKFHTTSPLDLELPVCILPALLSDNVLCTPSCSVLYLFYVCHLIWKKILISLFISTNPASLCKSLTSFCKPLPVILATPCLDPSIAHSFSKFTFSNLFGISPISSRFFFFFSQIRELVLKLVFVESQNNYWFWLDNQNRERQRQWQWP